MRRLTNQLKGARGRSALDAPSRRGQRAEKSGGGDKLNEVLKTIDREYVAEAVRVLGRPFKRHLTVPPP